MFAIDIVSVVDLGPLVAIEHHGLVFEWDPPAIGEPPLEGQ